MKKKKAWLWIILLIVLTLLVVGWLYMRRMGEQLANQLEYATYTVDYGTVTRSITGSGKLAAVDTVSVKAEKELEVSDVSVQIGDSVHIGDVLLTYDTDSIQDQIDALYADIASLDQQIARRSTRSAVTSPTTGRVKEIYADVGDSLDDVMRTHGALLLLSSDDTMHIDIATERELKLGKTITVQYNGRRISGRIANKTSDGYRITLPDGDIKIGENAELYDRNEKIGEGKLVLHAPVYVYGNDGIVESVDVSVNGTVRAYGKLFTIAEPPNSVEYGDALRKRDEKANEIQDLYALLDHPVLTAEQDGIVADIYAKAGEAVTGDAFTLHTGGAVKMTVAVDELDIGIVLIGQQAAITLDAFAGEVFPAEVTHISRLATASGSITTYDIELTLTPDDRLWEGMNGSAIITAQQKENVLLIPVKAIFEDETGVYVYVQVGEESVRRDIVTGLSDGTNVEIVSGLSAGEIIQYQNDYIGIAEQYQQFMRSNSNRGGW